MQETCLNILNAQILLLRTCRHKILPGCLGTEPGFQSLFLFLSLDSLYNTIVPFPVPGNADFQFYFKKRFLSVIQKKINFTGGTKSVLFFFVSSVQFILYERA